jgi:hypothetical protein
MKMSDNVTKLKLCPVRVPWRVDFDVSNLELSWKECGGTTLDLDAYWGSHVSEAERLRCVRIRFKWVQSFRMKLEQVTDENAYECFEFPGIGSWMTTEEIDKIIDEEMSHWQTEGICPDPEFYFVENSTWYAEINQSPPPIDCKHYVIFGHDAYLEILAHGFEWEVLPSRPLGGAFIEDLLKQSRT